MEISTNRSDIFIHVHPCYKLDMLNVLFSNPSAVCFLFHVFLSSLSAATVCGNLLVILSIAYFKQLQTPTNSLVLSLAVADLLVGIIVFPLSIAFPLTPCIFHHDVFCAVRGTFEVCLCTASILNLCCISIDRYYAVCRPLSYKTRMNDNVVLVMILLSWTVSALVGLGLVFVGMNQANCEDCFVDKVVANVMGLIFAFYLPVVIMLCIYLKIFTVAQKQAHSIQNATSQIRKSGGAVSKMEKKATKTLATVMGVFLICWLPFFLCTTARSFSRVFVPLEFVEFLNWLALSNSMLNPLIYAFFYSWFRSAFRMIVSGKIVHGNFTNSKLH